MSKEYFENFEKSFCASVLLVPQHIQILIKIFNSSISYDSFCKCIKHFESHCTLTVAHDNQNAKQAYYAMIFNIFI